ncbi:hypothetical protein BN2364_2469 [Alloalcanivorax xenomutans]|nr:hypothetical protein BN2364_2469 [Alloalcanivorax xenomutans]
MENGQGRPMMESGTARATTKKVGAFSHWLGRAVQMTVLSEAVGAGNMVSSGHCSSRVGVTSTG